MRAGLAVIAGVAAALLGTTPAGAQSRVEPTMAVTPTSGPIGTSITVTGTGCEGPDVRLELFVGSLLTVDGLVDVGTTETNPDGTWTSELRVWKEHFDYSTGETLGPVVPGSGYFVHAECGQFLDDPDEYWRMVSGYDIVPFEVTASSDAAPTAPTTEPARSDRPGAGPPPVALPATPVKATPNYTC